MEKTVIVGSHSTHQFYGQLFHKTVCSGILNSDGNEVYTIGLFFTIREPNEHV